MGPRIEGTSPAPIYDAGAATTNVGTVQVGETRLSQVADRLGVDVGNLLAANPQLSDPNHLTPGMELHLPSSQPATPPVSQSDSAPPHVTDLAPAPKGDPIAESAIKAILDAKPQIPLAPGALKDIFNRGDIMLADNLHPKATAASNEPAEIKDFLTNPQKNSNAKDAFAAAQKAIEAGDYTKAYQEIDKLLRTNEEGLWPDEVTHANAVRDQLGFLSKMQQAGIKADYQPSEAQLVDYFKTLSKDPGAARQAFEDYTQSFHVHGVNVYTGTGAVDYPHAKVKNHDIDIPQSWGDVTKHPVSKFPKYVGRQANDCKGFGYMAEKLLGAAGFKVVNNVAVYPGPHDQGHEMVVFQHPSEKGYTVTSNDKTFQAATQKAAAKAGFEYAAGKENVTGKEHYWTGKTMGEAIVEQVIQDHELK